MERHIYGYLVHYSTARLCCRRWPAPPLQLPVNAATTNFAIATLTFNVNKIAEVGRLLSVHRDVVSRIGGFQRSLPSTLA
jgi:hypothetical protein